MAETKKSIARAKRFVLLLFFWEQPQKIWVLPPSSSQTFSLLAIPRRSSLRKNCNKTAERKATSSSSSSSNSLLLLQLLDFTYLATKPKMGKHTLKTHPIATTTTRLNPHL
jgi:hypothetical protein